MDVANIHYATLVSMLAKLRSDMLNKPNSRHIWEETSFHWHQASSASTSNVVLTWNVKQWQSLLDKDNVSFHIELNWIELLDWKPSSPRRSTCLTGVSEEVEGTQQCCRFSNLLVSIFLEKMFYLVLQRLIQLIEHSNTSQREKPRAVINCFHKFQTKDTSSMLLVVRLTKILSHDGGLSKIMYQLYTLKLKPSFL